MKTLEFKVHTPNLLKEIVEYALPKNNGMLFVPINQFRQLLIKVAERCSELNDPVLNKLMCQLTLYECADPDSKEYNQKILDEVTKEFEKQEVRL